VSVSQRKTRGCPASYYWIDPVKQVAGVYTTQLLPFYDAQAVSLFGAFESVVYDMTG
jgi:methyl acetate hydrolase